MPYAEEEGNLSIRRLPYYPYNLVTKALSLILLTFRYARYICRNDIILVYSGYLIGFQIIILLARFCGKQILFRSSLLDGDDAITLCSKQRLLKGLNRYCLKRVTGYFSINSEFTARWERIFLDDPPVIESCQGVDTIRFQPVSNQKKLQLRMELGLPSDKAIIVSAGYLLHKKGYREIFQSLQNLKFDFRYVVLGEFRPNPYHNLSKEEIDEMTSILKLGNELLGEKILFRGGVNNIENYFQAADVFVHGALQEGTPNALLEAMACALPCVVRYLPGLSGYLLTGRNSCTYNDSAQLTEYLGKICLDKILREELATQARQTILENCTFEGVANRIFNQA